MSLLKLFLISTTLVGTSVVAQTSLPQYGIKEDQPRTGSIIKRNLVFGRRVPNNKRYDELTADEKASVKGYYEQMEPGDEPPFPTDGLRSIDSALLKAQAKLLISGELTLVASVDADGQVTEVKTIGSPSPEMTRFAASVLLLTKFKPALCLGQPCRMEFPFRYLFRVE